MSKESERRKAQRLLAEHMSKYFDECEANNITLHECNKAIITTGFWFILSTLDRSHSLNESLELAKQGLEIFAKESYEDRLKEKSEFQNKVKG